MLGLNWQMDCKEPKSNLTKIVLQTLALVWIKSAEKELAEAREIAGLKDFEASGKSYKLRVSLDKEELNNLIDWLDTQSEILDYVVQTTELPKIVNNHIHFIDAFRKYHTKFKATISYKETEYEELVKQLDWSENNIEEYTKINLSIESFNSVIDKLEDIFTNPNGTFGIVLNENDKLYRFLMETLELKIDKIAFSENPILGESEAQEIILR